VSKYATASDVQYFKVNEIETTSTTVFIYALLSGWLQQMKKSLRLVVRKGEYNVVTGKDKLMVSFFIRVHFLKLITA
jgi:hypothetical protein